MQPSMPRPSTSTFMKRRASMSSLSHSMTWRLIHAAGSIGTRSSSRSSVRHETAGMLRQMPRKADQRARQIQRQAQPAVLQVEVELLGVRSSATPSVAPAPDCEASAPVTSSGRPSALPTSRTAPRPR